MGQILDILKKLELTEIVNGLDIGAKERAVSKKVLSYTFINSLINSPNIY